jgi:phosphoglucosamine mutase
MTVDFALRLASAAAQVLVPHGGKVLIGKDTRVSGYMFESALEAGFVAAGVDVLLTGPLPTPAIAYLTNTTGSDFGIVISASHNPYSDNGIKFFDSQGSKLSDETEAAIEALIDNPPRTCDSSDLGRATTLTTARQDYMRFCRASLPEGMDLDGLKVVIDASHGAAYKVAPRLLAELGADVIPVGCSPNGRNINDQVGSTRPDLLRLTVSGVRAHVGIALDGDGDRVVMVDERGEIVDGDGVLYILAADRRETNALEGPVVGTVMSNLGLEQASRQGWRPSGARNAARARRHTRRRNLGAPAVSRQDDDGRRPDHCAAGSRRDAPHGQEPERAGGRYEPLAADSRQRQGGAAPADRDQ